MKKIHLLRGIILTGLLIFSHITASAYDFKVDGIYYSITSSTDRTVEVTYYSTAGYNTYSGDVTIPDAVTYKRKTYSVTGIGSEAFRACTSLKSVTIPDAVTSIGGQAFYGCTSLTSITIPDAVTSIGSAAFGGCSGLTSVSIGDAVTRIGSYAFMYCTGLTSITIPDAVTIIGSSAFSECESLTSVTIGNAVKSIGGGAFSNCSSLTSITIPDAVTSIGGTTFEGCSSLTSITIPDAVPSIGYRAFYGCSSLTSVSIGEAVTSIGYYAFMSCTGLTSVYSYNTTPPTCDSSDCFGTTAYRNATLHVPEESVADYASATAWKEFLNIEGDAETSGIGEVTADGDEPAVSIRNGCVCVAGLADGTSVAVYSIDGRMIGSAAASGGTASINAPSGVVIVKIGNRSQKVLVR